MLKNRKIAASLILPSVAWMFLFFVVPMAGMLILSLRPDMRGGPFQLGWIPTLKQYLSIFNGDVYLPLLWLSIRVAFTISLIATLLAYPLAYFLVFYAGKRAGLLLTLAILPFWTSYLLRIVAWKTILGSNGLINNLLIYLRLVNEPVRFLLYSRLAVNITLIYLWLPFVALPIFASLQRINPSLLEAAANLGSSPWRTFLRVTLPLSLPGVIAGFFLVFIPTVGEYITPVLVGGTRSSLYGNIINLYFGDGLNWPLGSAMSIVMLVVVLLLALIVSRLVDLRKLVG